MSLFKIFWFFAVYGNGLLRRGLQARAERMNRLLGDGRARRPSYEAKRLRRNLWGEDLNGFFDAWLTLRY